MGRCFVMLAGLGVGAVTWVACGKDKPGPVGVRCGDLTVPGVLVNAPSIQLAVRNRFGQAEAAGASIMVLDGGTPQVQAFAIDSLTLLVYQLRAGTYNLAISKPFYRDTTLSSLVVQQGECAAVVQTTKASVVLELAPGAPPVRSVAVFGTAFLATPGSQIRVASSVDADPGVSQAVTWRLIDTTMARIDQTGIVTSKCTTRGGTDTVTATAVADPKVSGRTTFGVGPSASCP